MILLYIIVNIWNVVYILLLNMRRALAENIIIDTTQLISEHVTLLKEAANFYKGNVSYADFSNSNLKNAKFTDCESAEDRKIQSTNQTLYHLNT